LAAFLELRTPAARAFQQAIRLMTSQVVGVFPEGTKPMVQFTQPNQMNEFQRIFPFSLAYRSARLGSLPVAIASLAESTAQQCRSSF